MNNMKKIADFSLKLGVVLVVFYVILQIVVEVSECGPFWARFLLGAGAVIIVCLGITTSEQENRDAIAEETAKRVCDRLNKNQNS